MKTIKCYYCGKRERQEFDTERDTCFSCQKLSTKERYNLWRKNTNKSFSENMKRNRELDKKYGAEKLVDFVG